MPDSGPTGREWGEITNEVGKLSHDVRNLRMVTAAMSEEIDALEISLSSLQVKIYTTIAVCTTFAGIAAFVTKTLQ